MKIRHSIDHRAMNEKLKRTLSRKTKPRGHIFLSAIFNDAVTEWTEDESRMPMFCHTKIKWQRISLFFFRIIIIQYTTIRHVHCIVLMYKIRTIYLLQPVLLIVLLAFKGNVNGSPERGFCNGYYSILTGRICII
jgi:hypothetical protein